MRHRRGRVFAAALAALLFDAAAARAAPELDVFSVPTVVKVGRHDAPGPQWRAGRADLESARNEREALQMVVRADAPVDGLWLRVGALRNAAGAALAPGRMKLRRAEWVDVAAPGGADGGAAVPDLRPDPLVPVDPGEARFSLAPGENLVFWLIVEVPEEASPGRYAGEILLGAGASGASLRVELQVRDFALPRRPLLQGLVGLNEGNLYRAHGARTSAEREAVVRLYLEEYARARLSPFLYGPSTAAFNPLPGARIDWTFERGADGAPTGAVAMDFAGFDREGERYLDGREAFGVFNVAPYFWVRPGGGGRAALRIADATGLVVDGDSADGSANPLFESLVVEVLRRIAEHLARRGWLDRAVYYVADEPTEDDVAAVRRICLLARRADPRLRTAVTLDPAVRPGLAGLVDAGGRSLVSIWIARVDQYDAEVAAGERAKGAEYWIYDVRDAALITQAGLANRGILWTAWRRGATGYLYFLSNYWGRDRTPWDGPDFAIPGVAHRYRAGEGFLLYPPRRRYDPEPAVLEPPVPSIRWELLREGAEDYDALTLLARLTAASAQGLPEAQAGLAAAAAARDLADTSVPGTVVGPVGVAALDFGGSATHALRRGGWEIDAAEGWLRHDGGTQEAVEVSFAARVPDGRYELVASVYADPAYRGRPYSRFTVGGRAVSSPTAAAGGSVDVAAGEVAVEDGRCRFLLGPASADAGAILYRFSLRRRAGDARRFDEVRALVYGAVERLAAAQAGAPPLRTPAR